MFNTIDVDGFIDESNKNFLILNFDCAMCSEKQVLHLTKDGCKKAINRTYLILRCKICNSKGNLQLTKELIEKMKNFIQKI